MITEGNIFKTFLLLSLPGIAMIFIQAAMPIIDGIFIFNYDDAVSGGAIAYCANLQGIITMGVGGLSVAGAALIGQTNGSGDLDRAKNLAAQLLSLVLLVGVFFAPVFVGAAIFFARGMEPRIQEKIFTYSILLGLSIPMMVIQVAFNSIKNVFGHPETTFIRTCLFVPIKLFFTYLFVVVLRLGIIGAGISVFFAYFCICIFIIYDLFLKKSDESLQLSQLKPKLSDYIKYFKIGWASVLQNSTKSIGFFLVRLDIARYGEIAMSAQALSGDVNNMFQNFTICFDSAIVSFVSINIGAGNGKRAKKAAYLAVKIGVISSLVLAALSVTLGPTIIRLYTNDPEIISIALRGNLYFTAGFTGFAILFNEMPAFIALGLNKVSLLIQTLRIWVVRFLALYLLYFLVKDIGVDATFISLSIANIVGGIISHLFFRKVKWEKRM